jgi:hypothetical protein
MDKFEQTIAFPFVGLVWIAAEHWSSAGFFGFVLFGIKGQAKELWAAACGFLFSLFARIIPATQVDAGLQYKLRFFVSFQNVLIHFFVLMLCNLAVDIRLPML